MHTVGYLHLLCLREYSTWHFDISLCLFGRLGAQPETKATLLVRVALGAHAQHTVSTIQFSFATYRTFNISFQYKAHPALFFLIHSCFVINNFKQNRQLKSARIIKNTTHGHKGSLRQK